MSISFIMECTILKKIQGKLNIHPGKSFWGGFKKNVYIFSTEDMSEHLSSNDVETILTSFAGLQGL